MAVATATLTTAVDVRPESQKTPAIKVSIPEQVLCKCCAPVGTLAATCAGGGDDKQK